MKVLYIIRATAFEAPGGDTVQARSTAKYLRRSGMEVDIRLTNEEIDYAAYDLMHFFNIIRPADIVYHVKRAGIPFVISPIFVNYSEYERKNRNDLLGLLSRTLPMDTMEYIKVIARSFKNRERIRSREYLWKGHRRSVRALIEQCNLLLPNSDNEIHRLFDHYQCKADYRRVYNGIDTEVFKRSMTGSNDREGVLCVGQIQGLKNQLSLIKALKGTGIPLTFIGKPTLNSGTYYKECRKVAGEEVKFIEYLPQNELINYYRKSKVHILPSWFETTGLVSLEAAAMGCNVVITRKGDAFEYFGGYASYCDPSSENDIKEKVLQAMEINPDPALKELIYEKYTWSKAAEVTLDAYKEVLS